MVWKVESVRQSFYSKGLLLVTIHQFEDFDVKYNLSYPTETCPPEKPFLEKISANFLKELKISRN